MSAHHFEREIPPAYFAAVGAARVAFPAHFGRFKKDTPEQKALGTADWMAKHSNSLSQKRDAYFSALDRLLEEIVKQGSDPACQIYRRCCEAAYDTLKRWGVNVPNIPSWVDTTREPEHIRMGRFLEEYRRGHQHGGAREEMPAWLEHK